MNRSGSNKLASSFQKSAKYLNIISTNKFINFNYSSIEINRLPPWYKNHNFYRYPSQIIDILGIIRIVSKSSKYLSDSKRLETRHIVLLLVLSLPLFLSKANIKHVARKQAVPWTNDLKRKVKYDLWPETRRGGREEGIYRGILYRYIILYYIERWKDWARLAVARSVPAPAFDIYARYKNGNNQWNQL